MILILRWMPRMGLMRRPYLTIPNTFLFEEGRAPLLTVDVIGESVDVPASIRKRFRFFRCHVTARSLRPTEFFNQPYFPVPRHIFCRR